jgi:hypothetical protein
MGRSTVAEVGEEIVGAYLKECLGCDFVEYNYDLGAKQAECDVVGFDIRKKRVYLCEVTTHTQGLLYVNQKTRQPDTETRLKRKFNSVVSYARARFTDFDCRFMFWSPIVPKAGPDAKYNAWSAIVSLKEYCRTELQVELQTVTNEEYLNKLLELRALAKTKGSDSPFPILRFLQIEEKLREHLSKRHKTLYGTD